MKIAVLTEDGAKRIGRPDLAGKEVTFDGMHPLGLCAKNVFYQGEYIAGMLSIGGDDRGLSVKEDENE